MGGCDGIGIEWGNLAIVRGSFRADGGDGGRVGYEYWHGRGVGFAGGGSGFGDADAGWVEP